MGRDNLYLKFVAISLVVACLIHKSYQACNCTSDCLQNCLAGQYWSISTGNCQTCPVGNYCPGGPNAASFPCSDGFYQQTAGQSDCNSCPAGSGCPTKSTSVACPLGSYSPGGLPNCLTCPSGFACASGTGYPTACTAGQYLTPIACFPCPAGSYCPSPTSGPVLCPAGTYQGSGGQTSCTNCPVGYRCPAGSTTTTACPAGLWSPGGTSECLACPNGTFATGSPSSCALCPAGSRCMDSSGNILVSPVQCAAGQYSTTGAMICFTCTPGSYSAAGSSSCTLCPAGKSCNDPTVTSPPSCSSGYYSLGGLVLACSPCPAGFQCPNTNQAPVPCALGSYSQPASTSCTACPAGAQCLSPQGPPVPCPSGYYAETGGTGCTVCPAGSQCISGGKTACSTGSYSVRGQSGPCLQCPVGSMCPFTNVAPTLCPTGYTTNGLSSQTTCSACPTGSACPTPSVTPVPCTSGSYALAGSTVCTVCPIGFACPNAASSPQACIPGSYAGTASQTSCTVCPAAYACPSTIATSPTPCQAGSYATGNQTSCTLCPAGKACPDPTGATITTCAAGQYSGKAATACIPCPPGWQCPSTDGSANTPCQPGSYSGGGLQACVPCPAGSYCPSTTASGTLCPAGSYSLANAVSCTQCPAGSFCPSTSSSTTTSCPTGSYSAGGLSSCVTCPAGYYCPSQYTNLVLPCAPGTYSTGSATQCTACPAGSQCPSTTAAGSACAAGSYALGSAAQCIPCPAGYQCSNAAVAPVVCPAGQYSRGLGNTSCLACNPGYACPEGSTRPDPPNGLCPMGSYCTNGQTVTPCPIGTYGPAAGASILANCTTCPATYYCPVGTSGLPTSSLLCPMGYFCPTGTGDYTLNPCPAGNYYPSLGAVKALDCLFCPAGRFCPAGSPNGDRVCPSGSYCPAQSGAPTPCPSGTYTTEQGAVGIQNCLLCPTGAYCPPGSSSPILCSPGTYNRLMSKSLATDCVPCDAGKSCTTYGLTQPDLPCMAGYYCPGGNYRPNQTEYACPAGTYTDQNNLASAAQCQQCNPTMACLRGTGGQQVQPVPCAAGYYCPTGTASPTQYPCPAGTFSNATNLASASQCQSCPPSLYCLQGSSTPTATCPQGCYCPLGTAYGSQFPCPAGTYNNGTGLLAYEQCVNCPQGSYCPQQSILPIPCLVGFYNNNTNGKSVSDCAPCMAGYFCPQNGSVSPQACSKGSFSAAGAIACSGCSPGYYCNQVAINNTNLYANLICPAGLTCPGNVSFMPDLVTSPCPVGYYCPPGNVNPFPVPCPNGTFNPTTGMKQVSDCTPCTPSYYCNAQGLSAVVGPCPGGYYCPLGTSSPTSFPCGIGFYRNGSSAQSAQDCSECVSGGYCNVPGLAIPIPCTAGYYCPPGTITPQPCPLGTYSNTTGLRRSTDCAPCPGGYYCAGIGGTAPTGTCDPGFYCSQQAYTSAPPDGATGGLCFAGGYCPQGSAYPTACPIGYYAPNKGSKNQMDCVLCQPGFYCPGSMLNNSFALLCAPGYYCTGGASTPTQYRCSQGYFSLAGAFNQQPCPPGTYQSANASSSCLSCLQGYYCNASAMVAQQICPPGAYCPYMTTTPINCPIGTYNNKTLMSDVSQCVRCTAGLACTTAGLISPDQNCSAGFSCNIGSITPTPTNISYGGPCPPGRYCPVGTVYGAEPQCPNGTFSNATGLINASQCIPCLAGSYCSGLGLTVPTGPCSAGYYCLTGSMTPTPQDNVQGAPCPIGTYCLPGSAIGANCPDGTYASTTMKTICDPCPAGFSCISGQPSSAASPSLCSKGFYCPMGTGRDPTPCPTGTYNDVLQAANSTACKPCPVGYACIRQGATGFDSNDLTGNMTGVIRCSQGYFCQQGVNVAQPDNLTNSGIGQPCPKGYYCPTQASAPQPCPSGTYRNLTLGAAVSDCFTCPPGVYCGTGVNVQPTAPCAAGYYCIAGSTVSQPPAGVCTTANYCPTGSSTPLGCPSGTYNNLTGQASCTSCPAGYYCPSGQVTYAQFVCPAAYYCPIGTGSSTQFPCPRGTYLSTTGAQDVTSCVRCTPGMYCVSQGQTAVSGQCSAGYFCLGGAWSQTPSDYYDALALNTTSCICPSNTTGGICPIGSYCPAQSIQPTKCPQGQYCATTGLATPTGSGLCNAGYYCIGGATRPDPIDGVTGGACPMGSFCVAGSGANPAKCPLGTFSNQTGLTTSAQCLSCTAGSYCGQLGLIVPSGPCFPGYYCPSGQSSATAIPCTAGNYCPAGSSQPLICPSGTWQGTTGQSSCVPCPAGYFCDSSQPAGLSNYAVYPCPLGYYCPNGTTFSTQFPCPPGTYSNATKLTASSGCTPCTAGNYCLTPGLTSPQGPCTAGYWCIQGAATATPTDNVTGSACPQGSYCPAGTPQPVPCPVSTWSNSTRLSVATQCLSCLGGYYCASTGLTGPTAPCAPGYYCTSTATVPNPTDGVTGDTCTTNHYCPLGTKVPLACPDGTYMPNRGSTACWNCTAGYYCVAGAAPQNCPVGYYCPQGTGQVWQACPPGTYSTVVGLSSAANCTSCDPGMYCAYPNSTAVTGPCLGGYFCQQSASRPNPPVASANNGPCPAGSYCPTQTGLPPGCPLGTYSNVIGLTAASSCTSCDLGSYCASVGLTSPTGKCWAGFYCLSGAQIPNPITVTTSGGPCPSGYFCPNGTASPLPCTAGTYTSVSGQATCTPCPAGYYCPTNTSNYASFVCPAGYVCPQGTPLSNSVPCPVGTYNNQPSGQSIAASCKPCDPGKYCGTVGLTAPTAPCDPGWFCLLGAMSARPSDAGNSTFPPSTSCVCPANSTGAICPVGSYCPQGSSVPQPCTAGSYCDVIGLSIPTGPCTAGYYCPAGTSQAAPAANICPTGSYCPRNSSTPTPCPQGTYTNATGNVDVTGCQICTAGSHCSQTGLTAPSGLCNQGYFCPPGQNTSTPPAYQCTPGHYCPQGSAFQFNCTGGLYQDQFGQASCKVCPAGSYCDGSIFNVPQCSQGVQNPVACPAGFFCPNASKSAQPCPAGTFNNVTQASASSACLACTGGQYCGSGGLSQPTGPCTQGYYCTLGSLAPAPTDNVTGNICPAGSYCPIGSAAPNLCPPGFYGPTTGLKLVTDCTPCDPGKYCPTAGLVTPAGPCTAGYFCPNASLTATPAANQCPVGSACPTGSAVPVPCTDGNFAGTPMSAICVVCTAGFYCSNGSNPVSCPQGYYCPAGTGRQWPPCPIGSYGSQTNLTNVTQCIQCPGGSYCQNPAQTVPSGVCQPGYYCSSGSDTATPSGANRGTAGICPLGFYCPQNSSAPIACPVGTFNNKTLASSPSDCLSCPPGAYCNSTGLPNPTAICQPGFYCTNSSTAGNPGLATWSGGFCSPGSYCPSGTPLPLPCLSGTYTDTPMMSSCSICTAGFYCPTAAPNITICPVGAYCPVGSGQPSLCPNGTFNSQQGQTNISACQQCTPGRYCASTGLAAPTGQCSPGYYCILGSFSAQPVPLGVNATPTDPLCGSVIGGPCRPGYYCPQGSARPTPCTPGSYCQNWTLATPSGLCSPGYYCTLAAVTATPTDNVTGAMCPSGYYCPQGSFNATACPPGSFLPTLGNSAPTDCAPCTPGQYCPSAGMAQPAGPCQAGSYCPQNSTQIRPPGLQCFPGNMCPQGSPAMTPCPSGTYQPLAEQVSCLMCPAGSYCDQNQAIAQKQSGINSTSQGVVTPSTCPMGFYCPNGTTAATQFPCPIGTLGNATGLQSLSQCSPCAAQYYCASINMTSPTGLCAAGYYCVSGASTPTPNTTTVNSGPCPQGSYCPLGTSSPILCPMGTYGARILLTASTDCTPCTPGQYCATLGLTSPSASCLAGYFCSNGSTVSNPVGQTYGDQCPVGSYCPTGSYQSTPCLSGTYQPLILQTSAAACLPCIAGFYCGQSGLSNVTGPCASGYYCPAGTNVSTPAATICPVGSSCPTGSATPTPCANGSFANVTGKSSCDQCPQGYYCVSQIQPVPCPKGYYCPVGTGPVQAPCPVSTYNPQTQMAVVSDCTPCPGGSYCASPGLAAPTNLCSAGYYCTQSVNVSQPGPSIPFTGVGGICPAGYSCPSGTGSPQPCAVGSYTPSTGYAACLTCPPRSYCLNTTVTPIDCPMGYYCPNGTQFGTQYPCPAGYFYNSTRAASQTDCLPCPPGMYCAGQGNIAPTGLCDPGFYCFGFASSRQPQFTGNLTTITGSQLDLLSNATCNPPWNCVCPSYLATTGGLCPAGYFCPLGTPAPVPCTSGMYCPTAGLSTPAGNCSAGFFCILTATSPTQAVCPQGSYCPIGTGQPNPCPAGTFLNSTRNTKLSDCIPCTPGMYCAGTGNANPTGLCSTGFYCPAGQNTSGPAGTPCTPGNYCPNGTALPLLCPNGTYTPNAGQSTCLPCPPGFFCNPYYNNTPVSVPYFCPRGYYCPQGTGIDTSFPCPVGTFGASGQLSTQSSCTACTAGAYCAIQGLTTPSANCTAGFYCSGGAKIAAPVNDGVTGTGPPASSYNGNDRCPAGYFCPAGSSSPTACPLGTYNPTVQALDVTGCLPCPAGRYCASIALVAGTSAPICDPGYVCSGGASGPQPANQSQGGFPCPPGFYCPAGTTTPLGCPPGTYQGNYRQANCTYCPAGFQCGLANTSAPLPCSPGYYCPGGGVLPQPCPPGTYNNITGQSNPANCLSCLAGSYCQGSGNSQPTGLCQAGYFCQGGANASVPVPTSSFPLNGLCQAGRYCPQGTQNPINCPSGTIRNSTGGASDADCQSCPGGFYCTSTGLTVPTGLCDQGYYCPGNDNTTTKNPPNRRCPINYYCPQGSAQPIPCTSGTSQPNPGQGSCDPCPAGYYCQGPTNITACPPYNFCPAGSFQPTPCLLGSYTMSNMSLLQSANQCLPCSAGSYCRTGRVDGPCSAGFFCLAGSYNSTPDGLPPPPQGCPNQVPYCAGPCPPGNYCPQGATLPIPCPAMTIRMNSSGASLSDCQPCPSGYQCLAGNSTLQPCPPGNYCPTGSAPVPCPLFTYRALPYGQFVNDCSSCPAGFYCNSTGITNYTNFQCPPGYFCPSGLPPTPCLAGTMRSTPGAGAATDCSSCTAGYYCPANRVNVGGIPCDPGYQCPAGSSLQTFCVPGSYCIGTTGIPPLCPGGYYCPNATITPILCPWPYYCPVGSNMTLRCPLGSRANDLSGVRITATQSCITCPAGSYGNSSDRNVCLQCPPGYFCPEGTTNGDDNPCPVGYYCPAGSSSPTACPVGTYNTNQRSYPASDCQLCPTGTYNNLQGMTSCKPCGSSSTSVAGSQYCTCAGKYRSFQVSDGSCLCYAGYIYYDDVDKLQTSGDGRQDCQPIVDPRCPSNQVLVAATRQCAVPTAVDCSSTCSSSGGGAFDTNYGACFCNQVTDPSQVCSSTCQSNAPVTTVSVSITGVITFSDYDPTNKTTTTRTLTVVGGLNSAPSSTGVVIYLNFWPDRCSATVPTNTGNLQSVQTPLNSYSGAVVTSGRRRLLATTAGLTDGTPQITNPIACVQLNEMVVFRLYIDLSNRSASNYPIYLKDHLYNTNPSFDYTPFTRLRYYIVNTNVTINVFANTFTVAGTYVFADAQSTSRMVIIIVEPSGTPCPSGLRIYPITQGNLVKFGISKSSPVNVAPDWGLVAGILAFLGACILLLIIAVIVWRPKHAGLFPLYRWKPVYRGLGTPVSPPLFLDHDEDSLALMNTVKATHKTDATAGVAASDGALALGSREKDRLDDFNVRVFYDKLEDQNLHVASQLARQATDLQTFYRKICEQNDRLRSLLESANTAAVLAAANSVSAAGVGFGAPIHQLLVGAGPGRSIELMAALKLLLDRLNSGQIQISKEMIERTMQGGVTSSGLVQTSSVVSGMGDMFSRHMAERLQLERELRADEVPEQQSMAEELQKVNRAALDKEKEKLMTQIQRESPDEINRALKSFPVVVGQVLDSSSASQRAREQALLDRLRNKRKEKEATLRKKHSEEAQQAGFPELRETANVTADIVAAERFRAQAESDADAAEVARLEAGLARAHVDNVGRNFEAEMTICASLLPPNVIDSLTVMEAQAKQAMIERQREVLDNLRRQMDETRARALHDLQQRHADELSSLVGGTPSLIAAMKFRQEAEIKATQAALDRRDAEVSAVSSQALARNYAQTVERNFNQAVSKVEPSVQQRIMEQHRREQAALEERDSLAKMKQQRELQTKLASRCSRQQANFQRSAEDLAMQRVVEEQQQIRQGLVTSPGAAHLSQMATDATVVGVPQLTSLITASGDSKFEQTLLAQHEKQMVDLQRRHAQQKEQLLKALSDEEKKEEEKMNALMNKEADRLRSEVKQKQAAELASRKDLSQDEMAALLALHNNQREDLENRLVSQKDRQVLGHRDRLARIRQERLEALKSKQQIDVNREELEQAKELAEARMKSLKVAETEAIKNCISENGVEDADRVVASVLAQRQQEELRQLDQRFQNQKGLMMEEALCDLDAKYMDLRTLMQSRHQKELASLEEKSFSPDEKQRMRTRMLAEQERELNELDRRRHDEEQLKRTAVQCEWEAQFAKAKLDLRTDHYRQFANTLRQYGRDHSAAAEADKQADALQRLKAELEAQRVEQEKRLHNELAEFEKKENQRMKEEMEQFKKNLEQESASEASKLQQQLDALEKRKQEVVEERQRKIEAEKERMRAQGISEDEQRRIVADFEKDTQILLTKMDADRVRVKSQVEERVKRIREQRLEDQRRAIVIQGSENKREFAERQMTARSERQSQEAQQLLNTGVPIPALIGAGGNRARETGVPLPPSRPGSASKPSEGPVPAQMPPAFTNTLPVSESEVLALLMQSPVYKTMEKVKERLDNLSKTSTSAPGKDDDLFDAQEKTWASEHDPQKPIELQPVPISHLEPRHFIVYKFGTFILDALRRHCGHPELTLLLADKLPPNPTWCRNGFRHSYAYDAHNRLLYVRLGRLNSVGEFAIVLAHASAHAKVGQMADDSRQDFLREMHRASSVLLGHLFFARWKQQPEQPNSPAGLVNMFQDARTAAAEGLTGQDLEETMSGAVDNLVEIRTLPSTDKDGLDFNKDQLASRMATYARYHGGQQLLGQLSSLEDNMVAASQQGTGPSAEALHQGQPSRSVPWRVSSGVLASSSGHTLFQSFTNLLGAGGKPRAGRDAAAASKPAEKGKEPPHETQEQQAVNRLDQLDSELAQVSRGLIEAKREASRGSGSARRLINQLELRRMDLSNRIKVALQSKRANK